MGFSLISLLFSSDSGDWRCWRDCDSLDLLLPIPGVHQGGILRMQRVHRPGTAGNCHNSQSWIRCLYTSIFSIDETWHPASQETPPEKPDFEKLQRNIVAENPRVTKFKINWEDPKKVAAEEAAKAAAAAAQAAASGSNGDVEMRLDQDPANQVRIN